MKLFNMVNTVIYENEEINNMRELVEAAVKERVDLRGTDLYRAYLRYADLRGGYLSRGSAKLEGKEDNRWVSK